MNTKQDDISWKEIQQGDEKAFRLLYDNYSDLLFGYGMKISGNEDVVCDAIQALFMYIFEKRKSLSVPVSISAYLCVSLRNILISENKTTSSKNFDSFDDNNQSDYDFELELDAESAIVQSETRREQVRIFQEELSKLTKQQREVLYLKYYKKLSTEDISKILGIESRTVYNTVHSAIIRLRTNPRLAEVFTLSSIISLLGLGNIYNF